MRTALLAVALLGCDTVFVPHYHPIGGADTGPAEASDGTDGTDGADGTDGTEPGAALAPVAQLARLSLDLRGTRPSLAEIEAVQADPDALDDLVAAFLADPGWAARVRWTWNDAVHTGAWAADYQRFGDLPPDQVRALGQEPLRVISAVAWEDRPFTDVVTADRIQANAALAELWGIDAPEATDAEGWGWAPLPDGRPMAGALSGNALWLRYSPDELSRNRVRANALARIFLCADFLEREGSFEFDVDPAALTDIEDAVATQGECLACHASLDPLASLFGGFTWKSEVMDREQYVTWSPHFADRAAARQEPAYYGVPAQDLADLGALVAADPRYARCGVERFYAGLVGAPPDGPTRSRLTAGWSADGLIVRALVADIVAEPAYLDAAPRVLTPEQLSTAFADLLGIDAISERDEITDGLGALQWSGDHRVLGGGTDDVTVLARNPTPSLGAQVLTTWATRSALPLALEADQARPLADRRLVLTEAGADEAAVRAGLARLHTRLLTTPVEADSAEVDRLFALWAASGEGPTEAWGAVTEALLRHPLMVLY